MRKYVVALLSIIAIVGSVQNGLAATLYVDRNISVSSASTYNPSTRAVGTGTSTVYKTIASASTAASAGSTILVRGGSYSESISPTKSGTASAPITYQAYPKEIVYLRGTTGIILNTRSYIVIKGFNVEDTRWLESNDSHYNVIQDCVFKRTPATGTTGNIRFIRSNLNRVMDCTIQGGQDNLLFIDSNYNLASGNNITEGRHSLFGIRCGDGNVIRANYFANTLQKIGEVFDCGDDTSAVANSFNSTSRNIIEGNIFAGTDRYYSSSGGNGIQYSGQRGIIRYNVFYDCNIGLGMQVYSDEALYNTDNRVYNNTFYNNAGAGIATRAEDARNVFKNNILAKNQGSVPDVNAVSAGQLSFRDQFGPSTLFDSNDLFYSAPGDQVVEEELSRKYTLAQAKALFPAALINTYELNPQFVNAAGHDFNLQPTSPLIDKGAFLTTTKSAGSGTVIPLVDASYFFEGGGAAGLGDIIKLKGGTTTARVVAVSLSNNTITVDKSLTWTAGQGIATSFSGSAPEIGAYELKTTDTQAPTVAITSPVASATISGTISITASASDNTGVAGVQFQVDGTNVGTEDVQAPYSVSYDSTKLASGTHRLTAVARDISGNLTTSTAVSVTASGTITASAVPIAPRISSSKSTVASPKVSITLQWDPVSGATSYRVKRATSLTGTWTLIATTTVPQALDSVSATGTTYYYTITAVSGTGESIPSKASAVKANKPAPGIFEAVGFSSNQMGITWRDATSDEDGFSCEVSTDGASWVNFGTTGPNVNSIIAGQLKAGTTYYFRVRAFKGTTFTPYSSNKTGATLQ